MNKKYDFDENLFNMIYKKYHVRMRLISLQYMGEPDDAQDVCQDAWLKVMNNLSEYVGSGSFEGWVRTIFVTTSLNALRKRDRQILSPSKYYDLSTAARKEQKSEQFEFPYINDIVSKMPAGYKTIFNLYAIEGYKHHEIAEMLGISANTSKSQYSRAKERIQRELKKIAA